MFTYDPISPVAMEISSETCLLCFDEFQVSEAATDTVCQFLKSALTLLISAVVDVLCINCTDFLETPVHIN